MSWLTWPTVIENVNRFVESKVLVYEEIPFLQKYLNSGLYRNHWVVVSNIFLIFIPIWGNDPNWRLHTVIFLRWIETTNWMDLPSLKRNSSHLNHRPKILTGIRIFSQPFRKWWAVNFRGVYMGVSQNRDTPKTPQIGIFSRKTHGCWVASF